MTSNSSEKIENILIKSAKLVADEIMNDALEELNSEFFDNIVDVRVSCDGSWQWRGLHSMTL